MQSEREKLRRGSGWGWGGDNTGEWGTGKRAMAPQGCSWCQGFEPQVEGGRWKREEENLLLCNSPPPPLPL